MATIRRHPVPTDSYDPKRPLNDLLLAQLEHFKHIARSLSSDVRNTLPVEPAIEDREGVDRFIQAITRVHVDRKIAKPQPVANPVRPKPSLTKKLAEGAKVTRRKNKPGKSIAQGKPKTTAKPSNPRSSKR